MAEQGENGSAQQGQAGETQRLMDDVEDAVMEAIHDCARKNDDKISIVARLRAVARRHRLPLKVNGGFTFADAVKWMRQGGPWRGFFIAVVGIASLASLTGVVAFALLLLSSSLNAAIASSLMAISFVGFFMAFFFSSITVAYVGALGFGGLTIGSIAFFSVWAVIILSGWAAIAWILWQGLRKVFQFARHLVFRIGSFLFSFPAAQRLQPIEVAFRKCTPLKYRKVAMD